MSRNSLFISLLMVVLMFAVVLGGCESKPAPAPTTEVKTTPPAEKPAVEPQVSPDQVPIEIVAYYPLNEGHTFIKAYLESVEKANPGAVTVKFYDMQSPEGREKWSDSGLSCAGVFVNGSTHHEITTNSKKEGVDFLQRMDVFWSHDDFEKVLTQILEKAGKKFVSPKYEAPKAEAGSTPAAGAEGKTSDAKG